MGHDGHGAALRTAALISDGWIPGCNREPVSKIIKLHGSISNKKTKHGNIDTVTATTRITDTISYIEPSGTPMKLSSAGLVISSRPAVVVDLSLPEADAAEVLREIAPERAYTTHFHYDHSQSWKAVARYSQAAFYVPEAEAGLLTDADAFMANTFGPYGTPEIRRGFLAFANYEAAKSVNPYGGNHSFRSGSSTIEAILTPGHSPGHTSFYLSGERIMFAGDLGLGRFGPWYGWVSCSIEEYIESLLRLKGYDTRILLTSHEGIVRDDIDGAWNACLGHFFSRETAIRSRLDAGRSPEEIAAEGIYFTNKDQVKEPMKTILTIWDRIMLDHHLKILDRGSLQQLFRGSGLPFLASAG